MKFMPRFHGYLMIGIGLAVILCLGEAALSVEYKEFKIGMTNPRSGSQVMTGDIQIAGVETALKEINAKGGIDGIPLKVIYEDHQAKPTVAVTAFQKLVSVDKVPLILTTYGTVQLAQAPLADKNKVVMVNSGASSPELINCSKYIFHTIPNSASYLSVAIHYLCETLGFKGPWGLLYLNSAEGKAISRYLSSLLPKYGVKAIFKDNWENYEVTDFRPIIAKALNTKPVAFYEGGAGNDTGLCLKQLRDAGFKGPVLCPYGGQLIQRAGVAVYNAYVGEQVIPENARVQALRNEVLNVRKLPYFSPICLNAYEAVYFAAEAIKYAKDHYKGDYFTGEKLRQAAREKRQFDTLSTPGALDLKTHVLSRQLAVKTWVEKDGKPVIEVKKVYTSEEEAALPKGEF
jgi:branched-chain amino acid transport system substrate-binding protein